MLARGLQHCCGCELLGVQQYHRRLLHRSVYRHYSDEQHASSVEENVCWVRQRSNSSLLKESRRKPFIKGPHDVLIKVNAASVNPMDVAMTRWYGKNILALYQQAKKIESAGPSVLCSGFSTENSPSVLGRDFSGTVEAVGLNVHRFKPGDEVFGATSPIVEGSHALYMVATDSDICQKPSNISHVEAASFPYAALTFLSGYNCVSTCTMNRENKRVHLNAAAGGVGSFATQYLKAIGCEVTVSVSKAAAEVVAKFNPDHILDYQSPTYLEELQKIAGFDIAFDLAGDESALSAIKPQGWFVTVVSPLLQSVDDNGMLLGGASAASHFAQKIAQALYNHGVYYSWAFFVPNRHALEDIKALIEGGKVKPFVDQVFPFEEAPAAYEKVSKGRCRGKVVIDMASP